MIFFSSSLSRVCVRARSTLVVVVNTSGRLPVVALPPATPAPPHGEDGVVSVHSGSGERERRRRYGGGRCGHRRGGRQPPLVLKPATTRSGLIYRAERERERQMDRHQRRERERDGEVANGGKE